MIHESLKIALKDGIVSREEYNADVARLIKLELSARRAGKRAAAKREESRNQRIRREIEEEIAREEAAAAERRRKARERNTTQRYLKDATSDMAAFMRSVETAVHRTSQITMIQRRALKGKVLSFVIDLSQIEKFDFDYMFKKLGGLIKRILYQEKKRFKVNMTFDVNIDVGKDENEIKPYFLAMNAFNANSLTEVDGAIQEQRNEFLEKLNKLPTKNTGAR